MTVRPIHVYMEPAMMEWIPLHAHAKQDMQGQHARQVKQELPHFRTQFSIILNNI